MRRPWTQLSVYNESKRSWIVFYDLSHLCSVIISFLLQLVLVLLLLLDKEAENWSWPVLPLLLSALFHFARWKIEF